MKGLLTAISLVCLVLAGSHLSVPDDSVGLLDLQGKGFFLLRAASFSRASAGCMSIAVSVDANIQLG